MRVVALPVTFVLLLGLFLVLGALFFPAGPVSAQGDPLTVEIVTGYNLVVDSNATATSTYAPSLATVMGRFCNTGTVAIDDVTAYIGDFVDGSSDRVGEYPVLDTDDLPSNHPLAGTILENSGAYSFVHVGGGLGLADAERYIGTLDPGECQVQYWHFTYPRCRNEGVPPEWQDPPCVVATWGTSVKPDDDMFLSFDIWVKGGGTIVDQTWTMTMRNEISAMANKIEPNPNGRWFNTKSDTVAPGDVITSNGILYELGNINQGFDNDGDFVPDYNAWMQPVGDPDYDPSCFRLIHTTGVLTISRSGGNSGMILPFDDRDPPHPIYGGPLYFTNLPADNTGVLGNVFYTFLALSGPCSTALSPYQEVASGSDNEKFNGDYGTGIPPLTSERPRVEISKASDPDIVSEGDVISYTIPFTNTSDESTAGLTLDSGGVNMPLVISDTVPEGLQYKCGSASASFDYVPASSPGYTLRFSTDSGGTWISGEPASCPGTNPTSTGPGNLIAIQWWLDEPLPKSSDNGSGEATFAGVVPLGHVAGGGDPFIENCADARFDSAAAFTEACTITMVLGDNSIGDYVWRDENRNGTQDDGATGINAVTVSLYWDKNGNGELDAEDRFINSTETYSYLGQDGYYVFSNLPDGDYLVVADGDDVAALHQGYRPTTDNPHVVSDLGVGIDTGVYYDQADFGFGPSLRIEKQLLYGGGYEGREVYYDITVTNLRPAHGEPLGDYCRYTAWASDFDAANSETGQKAWLNVANAYSPPGPDGNFATAPFENAGETLAVTGFDLLPQAGNVLSVEVILPIELAGSFSSLDTFAINVITRTTAALVSSQITYPISLQNGNLIIDVSDARNWKWADFGNSLSIQLIASKHAQNTGTLDLDAAGFRVVGDQACAPTNPSDIMVTVPLTDTYDANRLEFLYAEPPESGVITTTGLITWANIGPISPGESKGVRVTFLAKHLDAVTQIDNLACVTGTIFSDGGLANDDCDTATGIITPTGSISGKAWSEGASGSTIGWAPPVGYEDGDWGIPGVNVTLFACFDSSGNLITNPSKDKTCAAQDANRAQWIAVAAQTTDVNGDFMFDGLFDGYYYVALDPTSLPGSVYTGTADPAFAANGAGLSCPPWGAGTCDNLWGDPDAVLIDTKGGVSFTPISGASDITEVNFGYDIPAAIFGTIWQDHNGNGVRDPGDNGLDNPVGGITVTLTSSTGNVFTTTTDANGYYEFTDLPAGTYTIVVITSTLPAGVTWTLTDDPDPATTCVSTPFGACDDTYTVTVTRGQISGSHDFGYTASGDTAIGDTVYYDWDGDGMQDSGEEGIPDITVYLYEDSNGNGRVDPAVDALISTTVTADGTGIYPSGYYTFTGLPAGTYLVIVDTSDPQFPSHVLQTQDPDKDGQLCTEISGCDNRGGADTNGGSVDDVDFGYQPYGSGAIGDTVWRDMNGDGVQAGPQETGIVSITVELWVDLDGNGFYTRVATATTDVDGKYLFDHLPDADYRVVVDDGDPDLPQDSFGERYVPSTETTHDVTITNGSTYLDADFGFMPMGAIGDTIYWDANANGQEDWNEVGIGAGIVITLTNTSVITTADGTVYQPGEYERTTTTDENGQYLFTGLGTGTYKVIVGSLAAYGDPALTGDPDTNGRSCADLDPGDFYYPYCDGETTVTIYPGSIFLGADFGYQPPAVIGDYVWLDVDGDGVQDPGELPIAEVAIILTPPAGVDLGNGLGQPLITRTDPDGYYYFTFADPNDFGQVYTVSVDTSTLPSTFLTPTVGPDSNWTNSVTVTLDIAGAVTALGGNACTDCNLDVDFGYKYDSDYSITGHIFYDTLEDGGLYNPLIDRPYEGSTAYLWDSSGRKIGSTTTGADGSFSFTGLPAGGYTVSMDPNSPEFGDNHLTATPAEPGVLCTTCNNYNSVAVGPDQINQDFGLYGSVPPTAVLLFWFAATPQNRTVLLTWETATEIDVLGFHLYRAESPDGPRTQINGQLLLASGFGSLYEFGDEAVAGGMTYYYWLEIVGFDGKKTVYGPEAATVPATQLENPGPYRIFLPSVAN
jgi:uncharacterized repeat protein (TIGR01451 family)